MGETPREIVERAGTIATVGMSADESKPAHRIPRQLLHAGFDVVPVNPESDEILGHQVYATIDEVPVPIDVVQVFRPADEAPDIAWQAVKVGARVLWLQSGIVSPEARSIAEGAGLAYIENECMGRVQALYDITRR